MTFEEVYAKYEEQCEEACLDRFVYDHQQKIIDNQAEQIKSHCEFMSDLYDKLELENNLKMCNLLAMELSKEWK